MRNHAVRALVLGWLVLASTGSARAQTTITSGPITINDNIEYGITDVTSIAAAQATEVRIRVDSTTGAYSVVAAPTCTAAVAPQTGFRCTAKIPQTVVDQVNVRGTHQIRTYAFAGGVEGPPDSPFSITTPPAAPVNSRFTR